jgi:hypothetical protein
MVPKNPRASSHLRLDAFYQRWDEIAREREGFTDWIERHLMATADFAEFRRSLAPSGGKRPHQAANG